MIQVTSRGDRKQLKNNTEDIHNLQQGDVPTFERKYLQSNIKSSGQVTKIFQVRSFCDPSILDGDSYDRIGIYNCIEMVISNEQDGTWTGWQSPGMSPNATRMTDAQGAVSLTFAASTQTDDYDAWDSGTTYSVGGVVEIITQYTDINSSNLRNVSHIYVSLTENTNKPPATNTSDWGDLTVEVANISESMVVSTGPHLRYPKLTKYDTILATSSSDNTGVSRWSGMDTIGNSRIFQFTGETSTTTSTGFPIGNIAYITPLIEPSGEEAQEGDLNFNVAIRADDAYIDWTQITDTMRISATWVYGTWFLTPIFALSPDPSGNYGIEQTGQRIRVKVDETTIDFNGSGELEQIP